MANDYIIKNSNGKDIVYNNVEFVSLTDVNGNKTVFSEYKEDLRMYGKYNVKVIDFDGSLLKEEWLNSGDVFILPDAPVHEHLIFQQWVSQAEIVDNSITVIDSDILIGPNYTTSNMTNYLFFEFTKKTSLTINIAIRLNNNLRGGIIIDWGDGSVTDVTTNGAGRFVFPHTYGNIGNYVVKIYPADENNLPEYWLGSYVVYSSETSSNVNYSLKKVYISDTTQIYNYCFYHCYGLETVSLPSGITSIKWNAFDSCINIKTMTLPANLIFLGCDSESTSTSYSSGLTGCYSIETLVIPNTLTTICNSGFSRCGSLTKFKFSNDFSGKINSSLFYDCQKLKIVEFKNVLNLASQSFYGCKLVEKYDFSKCSAVPTLASTNVFNGISETCKIYVPDDLYDTWINSTNWTTYANYIYKASEMGGAE
jgi:hypothetical protein|nr:MAG TPA: leucine rich repeat protein [Caudoviricetes sp.]